MKLPIPNSKQTRDKGGKRKQPHYSPDPALLSLDDVSIDDAIIVALGERPTSETVSGILQILSRPW